MYTKNTYARWKELEEIILTCFMNLKAAFPLLVKLIQIALTIAVVLHTVSNHFLLFTISNVSERELSNDLSLDIANCGPIFF